MRSPTMTYSTPSKTISATVPTPAPAGSRQAAERKSLCVTHFLLASKNLSLERARLSDDATSGLLCGRLLVALVESVLRPGGWENMCRLMCHCVRHISLDNKYGRCVEVIHSFTSRWRAGTELCASTQKEPCGKKSSMGSENRQIFRCSLKSVATHSIPPERKPVALSNSSIYCE